jgi:hypothetical protein
VHVAYYINEYVRRIRAIKFAKIGFIKILFSNIFSMNRNKKSAFWNAKNNLPRGTFLL